MSMQEEFKFIGQPRVRFFLVSGLMFYIVWLLILIMADAIDNFVLLITPLAPAIAQFLWMRLCWERAKNKKLID